MPLAFTKTFPIIDLNDRFCLREHQEKDIQSFYNYYTPEVSEYILAQKPQSLNDARSEIQYCKNLFHFKRGIYWTIADKQTDAMIGAIGFTTESQSMRAELHYDLAKEYWGQGITTEAIAAAVHYAFDVLGAVRVEALTTKDNIASQKVLLKNNFIYEGCLHAYKYFEGQARDVEMFAITQQLWNP